MAEVPYVLVDQPEDGYCESWGWVEAIVNEDEARDNLSEFAVDDATGDTARPIGPAKKVWLRLANPSADYEFQRWVPCRKTTTGAREFWRIDCTEVERLADSQEPSDGR